MKVEGNRCVISLLWKEEHISDFVFPLFQAGNPGGPGPGGRGRGRGQGNWNMGPPGGLQEFNFIVPTGKTGLIIGKGNVFKTINV